MAPRTHRAWLVVLAAAIVAAAPVWMVPFLPFEDLPLHLATLRVVHSLHDPAYGLDAHFVLTLSRTQYVAYYVAGDGLSSLFGVDTANRILLSLYFSGSVLALAWLMSVRDRDPRLALLAVPLLYGPLLILGLLPFLLGVALLLVAMAALERYAGEPTVARGALVAGLAVLLFLCHVVPFAVFVVAAAAWFPFRAPRRWPAYAAPLLPAGIVGAVWLFSTDAGRQLRDTVSAQESGAAASPRVAARELFTWLGDSYVDRSDDAIFAALALVVVGLVAIAILRADDVDATLRSSRASRYRPLFVPVTCAIFYFIGGRAHGFVWPLAQRFAMLAALTALPLLSLPRANLLKLSALVATAAVALAGTVDAAIHYVRFDRDEARELATVLSTMEPRQKVCALAFEPRSQVVQFHPFLHFGSYYQEQRGGVVQFSFAGYNHWPFDYKPGHYPPPGAPARPRLEWSPRSIPMNEIYPYYDYVLTRGEGFAPPPGTYRLERHAGQFSLFVRDDRQSLAHKTAS